MTFEETTLGNTLNFYNGKAIQPGGEGEYPVYGSNGIIGGSSEYRYENCIIIGRVGAYCGSVNYCRGRFWASDNTIVVKPKLAASNIRFFAYMLQTMKLNRHAGGSAQPLVTQSTLKTVPASIPAPIAQARIASILSAYDNLIENNARRIVILEEMARRIYEEWFVSFRFPNHEGVRMVESDLGFVPYGWLASSIGEVATYINRGLAPKYDDDAAGLVINQKCIRGQRLSLDEARKHSKSVPVDKLVRLGDVLINSTGVGTLGRVAQVMETIDNCTVDTHVSIVRPNNNCNLDYFGMALLARQANFESLGVGSTGQTELGRGRIAETAILMPTLEIQNEFSNRVGPMRRLAVTLQRKNQNLRTTRDFLLPKLISGEIDVSAIPAPESIAA